MSQDGCRCHILLRPSAFFPRLPSRREPAGMPESSPRNLVTSHAMPRERKPSTRPAIFFRRFISGTSFGKQNVKGRKSFRSKTHGAQANPGKCTFQKRRMRGFPARFFFPLTITRRRAIAKQNRLRSGLAWEISLRWKSERRQFDSDNQDVAIDARLQIIRKREPRGHGGQAPRNPVP